MADIEIISQTPLTLAEVKVKVEKISSKGKEEPSARMVKVRDYMNDFSSLESKSVKELKEKLENLGIQRLKDRIIIKIIDIQPRTVDELKILFAGENVTLKTDDLTKILEAVQGK